MAISFDNIKNIAKGAGKAIFTDVPADKQGALYQKIIPKKIKSKYAWGAVGAVAVASSAPIIMQTRNRIPLGRMEAGEGLAHMTSSVVSSPLVQATQAGKYDTGRISNHITSYGADGDIVFALHNLR